MKVLLTARRGFDYNRVLVLLKGLAEVAPDSFEVYQFAKRNGKYGEQVRLRAEQADVIYVPPFRQRDVPFIRKYAAGRPIVLDPLIGTYITRVIDYGFWWRKPYARWLDRRHFLAADYIVFDTAAHRLWAIKQLGLPQHRCHTLYIGADVDLFASAKLQVKGPTSPIVVGFYGSLVPLQGVEKIILAAYSLREREDIRFELIGNIKQAKYLDKLRKQYPSDRVEYLATVPFAQLPEHIQQWDICLGIFGDSLKADVVVPNKVYHYAASGKAIITREARGIDELFTSGENIWCIPPTSEALAEAIIELAMDADMRSRLGAKARSVIQEKLTAADVARQFLAICRKVVQ